MTRKYLEFGKKRQDCSRCGRSTWIHNWKSRTVQGLGTYGDCMWYHIKRAAYICQHCKNYWVYNIDEFVLPSKRFANEVIRKVIELYNSGMTANEVSEHLDEKYWVEVGPFTVLKWVDKYYRKKGEADDGQGEDGGV
jgi:transposase-like protein